MKITPGNLIYHELIGLEAEVAESSNPSQQGIKGVIVDETRNMLVLEDCAGRSLRVAKSQASFVFNVPGPRGSVELSEANAPPAPRGVSNRQALKKPRRQIVGLSEAKSHKHRGGLPRAAQTPRGFTLPSESGTERSEVAQTPRGVTPRVKVDGRLLAYQPWDRVQNRFRKRMIR